MLQKADLLILEGNHKAALSIYYEFLRKHPVSKEAYFGILNCTLALKYYRHSVKTIFLLNGIHPESHLGHSIFLLKNSLLTHIRKKQDIDLLDFSIEMMKKSALIALPVNKSAFLEIQSDLLYEKGKKELGLKLKCDATIQKVKRYKNITEEDTEFRRGKLPDFIILGAQKTGTTALYEFLTAHPMVYPGLRKELFFFSNDALYAQGIDWYKAHFTELREKHTLTAEATATYFNDSRVCVRIEDALGKDIKKIFIFRNPSQRAVSDYYMKVRDGYEKRSLYDAITIEINLLRSMSENELQETIDNPYLFVKKTGGYVLHGLYYYYLKFFIKTSTKESIFIIDTRELKDNHHHTLQCVFDFLNIDNSTTVVPKEINRGEYVKHDQEYTEINTLLNTFYYQYNKKFKTLTGLDFNDEDSI